MTAINMTAGEHIEQHKKSGLTAVGQGDIALAQRPAKLSFKIRGHLADKSFLPLGRVVSAHQPGKFTLTVKNILQSLAKDGIHLRNVSGITATHHNFVLTVGKRMPQIIHQ